MSDDTNREEQWQFAQDKAGKFLLHVPSGMMGKVGKVYAPGEYRQPAPVPEDATLDDLHAGRVTEAVIEFEDGNSFLARPENFLCLSEGDQLTFVAATAGLKSFVVEIVEVTSRSAALLGSTPESLRVVLQAALRNQLRALEPR